MADALILLPVGESFVSVAIAAVIATGIGCAPWLIRLLWRRLHWNGQHPEGGDQ